MQHNLGKDEETGKDLIVDAAIFFRDNIIPIDAKFSLEKYNQMMEEKDTEKRDRLEKDFKAELKNRIDETAKYIRPALGTTEFAFMFMPAEGIYYNLMIYNVGSLNVNTVDLHEYAFRKHVIIVSPSSFFAYLQTVIQGLKALKMEESVKEIQGNVEQLSRHLNAYEDHMLKVGNHLGTTVNAYNNASREYRKIDKDIYKVTAGAEGGEVAINLIDKPAQHE
jgi:DNA recombination protein RmuC